VEVRKNPVRRPGIGETGKIGRCNKLMSGRGVLWKTLVMERSLKMGGWVRGAEEKEKEKCCFGVI